MTTPPDLDDEPTRKIVLVMRAELQRAQGAATVWRWLGGMAASAAIVIAGAALGYAQQAAVDHVAVVRHEAEIDGVRRDLDAIQAQLAAMTAILERVERRLDRESR